MKELAFIVALALSHPAAVKHIEQKYHVEYQGDLDLGHKKLWIFLLQTGNLGPILIATPAGAGDPQFEISEDAAIEEARFHNILENLPNKDE